MTKPFEVIQSETTYRGRILDVRRDRVKLPDGEQASLDVVAHSGAVALIPVDEKGQIWFVRQYRHPVGDFLLELPAGTLEEGEPPESCALREIREEIGMASDRLTLLGEFFLAPGYSTEYMYVFLAADLHPEPLDGDVDEFISVERLPVETAYRMAADGRIRDAKTLAGLFLARPHLKGTAIRAGDPPKG